MMQLAEDILTLEELEAIGLVSSSDNPRFDLLVKLSGLDPKQDFMFSDLRRLNMCGSDLRGFDFTGSDLRQCAKNAKTLIDETTIFADAFEDWIELDALPIAMKMREIETISRSEKRIVSLNEMIGEFGKSNHVVRFMVTAAANADTLDEFIDFATFLPPALLEGQAVQLRQTAAKLLKKKLSKSKSRTRREATVIFALKEIAERLKESEGSLAATIFSHLAKIVNDKHQTVQLRGIANIDRSDMEKAFERIGR